jgi:hypothetical protein
VLRSSLHAARTSVFHALVPYSVRCTSAHDLGVPFAVEPAVERENLQLRSVRRFDQDVEEEFFTPWFPRAVVATRLLGWGDDVVRAEIHPCLLPASRGLPASERHVQWPQAP